MLSKLVSTMQKYMKVLQTLFTVFREENRLRGEVFLPFRDAQIHDTPIGLGSVFEVFRHARLVPGLVSRDKLLDFCNAVCCTKSEASTLFYKRRDLRGFTSLKSLCEVPEQGSKIDVQFKTLVNDPKCFFYEFCLLLLMVSYSLAKNLVPKRDPCLLFPVFMEKVLLLAPDSEFESKSFSPSSELGGLVLEFYEDCFNEDRRLKKEYHVESEDHLEKSQEQSKTSLVNSIRVKSILSKFDLDCCFISKQKIESIIEELLVHLPTTSFEELLKETLNFDGSKQATLGFYPSPKDKRQPPRSKLVRHNKDKPVPFAPAPKKVHRTSQNQAFQFYLQTKQLYEDVQPVVVSESFVIIREVKPPFSGTSEDFLRSLDRVFLLLESREFELCQLSLNRLILDVEERTELDPRTSGTHVSYLSYLKGLFFDLEGDYQKAVYFYNEGLLKLRKFPETGASADIFFALGCLFFNEALVEMACQCFLKAKGIRDQYSSDAQVHLGTSSHHSAFLLNNIACCLVHFSRVGSNSKKRATWRGTCSSRPSRQVG